MSHHMYYVNLPCPVALADWTDLDANGDIIGFRDVTVDSGGVIRVWDSVAGHYTVCHDLTKAQQKEVLRIMTEKYQGNENVA